MWLPAWSEAAGRWHAPVGAAGFRFAVAVLSLLLVVAAAAASISGAGSVAAYAMAGYTLAMVLNVVFPHLLVSLFQRRYMPGTATGLLCNLPLGTLYLIRAISDRQVDPGVFAWAGPLVVAGIGGSIPFLFAAGRWLEKRRDR